MPFHENMKIGSFEIRHAILQISVLNEFIMNNFSQIITQTKLKIHWKKLNFMCLPVVKIARD